MKAYHAVVIKGTCVPRTTQDRVKPIHENEWKKMRPDFGLSMNPEFLRQGSAFGYTLNTDRIVISECDKKSCNTARYRYLALMIPRKTHAS